MNKTVVVEAGRLAVHPKYHKRIKERKVSCPQRAGVKVGDVVRL